jgi:hypothetical protein
VVSADRQTFGHAQSPQLSDSVAEGFGVGAAQSRLSVLRRWRPAARTSRRRSHPPYGTRRDILCFGASDRDLSPTTRAAAIVHPGPSHGKCRIQDILAQPDQNGALTTEDERGGPAVLSSVSTDANLVVCVGIWVRSRVCGSTTKALETS